MSNRELIFAVLNNKTPERTPVGFWYHFTENPGADVFTHKEMWDQNITGHRKYYKDFKPDMVKIMSDGFFVYPNPVLGTAKNAGELAAGMKSIGANHVWIEKQVELVKTLTAGFEGTPSFYNIFAPATLFRIARTALGQNGDKILADFLSEDAASVAEAFAVVAGDIEVAVKRIIQEGKADGIYLSAKDVQDSRVSADIHASSIAPGETSILKAAKAAGGTNILHICGYKGNRNVLSHFASYNADAVNWAVTVEEVSLTEGKKIFGGKPVIGGFANTDQGVLYKGTKTEIEKETKRIIEEAGRAGVIVGADCTIPADIATERLNWVRDAAK